MMKLNAQEIDMITTALVMFQEQASDAVEECKGYHGAEEDALTNERHAEEAGELIDRFNNEVC